MQIRSTATSCDKFTTCIIVFDNILVFKIHAHGVPTCIGKTLLRRQYFKRHFIYLIFQPNHSAVCICILESGDFVVRDAV